MQRILSRCQCVHVGRFSITCAALGSNCTGISCASPVAADTMQVLAYRAVDKCLLSLAVEFLSQQCGGNAGVDVKHLLQI